MAQSSISVEKVDELLEELSKHSPDGQRIRQILKGTGIPFKKNRVDQLYKIVSGLHGRDFIESASRRKELKELKEKEQK